MQSWIAAITHLSIDVEEVLPDAHTDDADNSHLSVAWLNAYGDEQTAVADKRHLSIAPSNTP